MRRRPQGRHARLPSRARIASRRRGSRAIWRRRAEPNFDTKGLRQNGAGNRAVFVCPRLSASGRGIRVAYRKNDNYGPKDRVRSRDRGSAVGSKQANAVDVHVGLRIRAARLAAGLSQERLGNELGVTFQQVQKYEKGSNRVGASRLSDAARILSVPVSFFFENDAGGDKPRNTNNGLLAMTEALSTPEGIRI